MRHTTARPRARQREERADWYRIRNAAGDDGAPAEVYIYDEISWWGVSAQDFISELKEITASKIRLRLNSPGGEVFDGIAIANLLRSHPAKVTTWVDGLAASIASVIALAGEQVIMQPHSQMMIHNPWAMCIGDAADMRDAAERLDRQSDNLAAVYAERAGGDVKHWRELMQAETWFSAAEAVAAGLADEVAEHGNPDDAPQDAPDDDAKARARAWDLSVFRYAGRAEAPAPNLTAVRNTRLPVIGQAKHAPPAGPAAGPQKTQEEDSMSTLAEGLRERLGIASDAELDDAALLEALDEALAERADDEPAPPVPEPEPVAARVPDGMVLIDEATLDELRSNAAEGVAARAQQRAEARDQALNEAIRLGKFPPARRAHYAKAWDADPDGTRQLLDSLAEGLVPLDPIGEPGGEPHSTEEDEVYDRIFTTPGKG
ncbi:head maturation protease, ClpP-related [Nonomuraea helvata]|uniref:ATP-dependent Clp protease proteolytic subunit n=1 Tax=Nonomuraea helvata TaxID=37484 RepID=A0ABV5SI50_9ACTN